MHMDFALCGFQRYCGAFLTYQSVAWMLLFLMALLFKRLSLFFRSETTSQHSLSPLVIMGESLKTHRDIK